MKISHWFSVFLLFTTVRWLFLALYHHVETMRHPVLCEMLKDVERYLEAVRTMWNSRWHCPYSSPSFFTRYSVPPGSKYVAGVKSAAGTAPSWRRTNEELSGMFSLDQWMEPTRIIYQVIVYITKLVYKMRLMITITCYNPFPLILNATPNNKHFR